MSSEEASGPQLRPLAVIGVVSCCALPLLIGPAGVVGIGVVSVGWAFLVAAGMLAEA